jgi:hypothetical protein
MSAADKSKLDGIAAGATVGVTLASLVTAQAGTGVGALVQTRINLFAGASGGVTFGTSYVAVTTSNLGSADKSFLSPVFVVGGTYSARASSQHDGAGTLTSGVVEIVFIRTA